MRAEDSGPGFQTVTRPLRRAEGLSANPPPQRCLPSQMQTPFAKATGLRLLSKTAPCATAGKPDICLSSDSVSQGTGAARLVFGGSESSRHSLIGWQVLCKNPRSPPLPAQSRESKDALSRQGSDCTCLSTPGKADPDSNPAAFLSRWGNALSFLPALRKGELHRFTLPSVRKRGQGHGAEQHRSHAVLLQGAVETTQVVTSCLNPTADRTLMPEQQIPPEKLFCSFIPPPFPPRIAVSTFPALKPCKLPTIRVYLSIDR